LKKIILIALVFINIEFLSAKEISKHEIKSSIVKIFTVANNPSFRQPWTSLVKQFTGSGCIIDGDKILTNAHVVTDSTYVEVLKNGEIKRYEAEVLSISHDSDLALITVKDKSFFENTVSLTIGKLPNLQEKVTVYGFPTGGDTLSITKGVISRIEHQRYVHSGKYLLAIQIDAPINSGNSGGPAISEGNIVGVVMQSMSKSQSIGYLVPATMINHFLKDIEDGQNDGFANLGIATQKIESTTLREMYGMDENSTGQLVINTVYNSSAKDILKAGDIITHIDGHVINNDGTVSFRYHQFTSYKYFIDLHQMGDVVELDIIRAQKPLKVKIKLQSIADNFLVVKTTRFDKAPTYFIYGGYVFVPLTKKLLHSARLRYMASRWPTEEKKEIVVLLKVLASELSQGNSSISFWPVEKINGKTFATFDEFYQIVENFKGDYLLLEDDEGIQVVMDAKICKKENEKILSRYNIKYDRSVDLR